MSDEDRRYDDWLEEQQRQEYEDAMRDQYETAMREQAEADAVNWIKP